MEQSWLGRVSYHLQLWAWALFTPAAFRLLLFLFPHWLTLYSIIISLAYTTLIWLNLGSNDEGEYIQPVSTS